jgi:quercetin dioxygenase-like cupin family protein
VPDDGGAAEIDRLRASVRILRIAAALLALVVGVLLLAPERRAEPRSEVVDVPAKMHAIVAEHGPDANQAVFFVETPSLSVHLHFMGRRHHCPLHIHPRGHEATVIVDGTAEVRHVFGRDGGLERGTHTFRDGDLIASPPGCAHAFTNVEADRVLGNLVFSSPAFDHNTYLASDDDERIGDAVPTTYSFGEEIAAFARSTDEQRRIPLVRGTTRIDPKSSGVSVLYVLSGSGSVEADRALGVGQKQLAIVRQRSPFTLRADSVLAALVYLE